MTAIKIGNLSGTGGLISLIDEFAGAVDSTQAEKRKEVISDLAKHVFWGLKQNWWMQIIDGSAHKLGHLVFDKASEPGYFAGIKKGCEFVAGHLQEPVTVKLYQDIHKADLCESVIAKISEKEVGKFNPAKECVTDASHLFDADPKLQEDLGKFKEYKRIYNAREFLEPDLMENARILIPNASDDQIRSKVDEAKHWLEARQEKLAARMAILNSCIAQKSRSLGLDKPLCTLSFEDSEDGFPEKIVTRYGFNGVKEAELTTIVEKIFADYEENMKKSNSAAEKLELIADLYQVLNWLHPFKDGQGRTTLILLSKELSRHGFNPAILDLPYYANYTLLPEWAAYLKEGIVEWQREFILPHRYQPTLKRD